MNIGQMMRGLLGDAVSSEPRTMELKIGQVVRGVVMGLLDNSEAIVQINGVQVRAKLEAPLQAGQAAYLQVQPHSNGALVVLKQVEAGAAALPEDTLRDYAKLLSLPDQRWATEIIKDLRREGFPFNRETARAFQQAIAAMPQGADQEQWMQAAAAGFKRGLPMTAASIGALQQVMFGQDAHQLLRGLEQQLTALAGRGGAEGASSAVAQAASRVLALLEQGAELLRQAAEGGRATQPAAPGGGAAQASAGAAAAQAAAQAAGASAAGSAPMASEQAQRAVDAEPQAAAGGRAGADAAAAAQGRAAASPVGGQWLGQMLKWLGVDHEIQLARSLSSAEGGQPQQSAPAAPGAANTAEQQALGTAASRQAAAGADEQAARPAAQAQQPGAGADAQAGQARPDRGAMLAAAADSRMAAGGGPLQPQPGPADGQSTAAQLGTASSTPSAHTGAETLKSALLTLISGADTPPAVRETAQQLVQHITGQQLMLTTERNNSMFTHLTLFIPLNDKDGGQTASVHIQTRRGRRGELDAENCRLLFDLSMKTLGATLVDVNITDKIVSLNLWNDHPATAGLIEHSRTEITERLQQAGYQLLSLRATSLPKDELPQEEPVEGSKRQPPPDASQFTSTRYKGVDYRI